MRTAVFACTVVALASRTDGFVGSSMRPMTVRRANSLRMTSEVTVPGLIKKTRELKLLSTAANLGLLSKLEKAGLSLKDVEKLLPLVDENDLIGLAKGLGPDLLNVAPVALSAAPAALPILASALSIPGEALFAAALASIAAGLAVVVLLPDDSMVGIALETFLAVPFLFVLPAVCGVGGLALSGLKNGWLIDTITSRSSPPEPVASVAAPVTIPSKPAPAPAVAVKAKPAPKKDSGRPALVAKAPAPKPPAPKKAAPKKVAPKPAPKPKPMGNIKNLPKAL